MGERTVAYLGPAGSYAHVAMLRYFGDAITVAPCPSIPGVFEAVASARAARGVVPIENSTEGGVTFTMDCLLEHALGVTGECTIDVEHCLIGRQSNLGAIERVRSHPQALAQCRGWLEEHLPGVDQVAAASTSGAVADLDAHTAAIAGSLAAQLEGVPVLTRGIQDRERNRTRFFVIGGDPPGPTGSDATAVVFSTRHERGALRRALSAFDEADINLTRIESRPHPSELWHYVFFTELEGHADDPQVATALDALRAACATVRILGSYPRASAPST